MPPTIIDKPWGQEVIHQDNDSCTIKDIVINEGEGLSIQFHWLKEEILYATKGPFFIDTMQLTDDMHDRLWALKLADGDLEPVLDDILMYWDTEKKTTELRKHAAGQEGFLIKPLTVHAMYSFGTYCSALEISWGPNRQEDLVRIYDRYGRT